MFPWELQVLNITLSSALGVNARLTRHKCLDCRHAGSSDDPYFQSPSKASSIGCSQWLYALKPARGPKAGPIQNDLILWELQEAQISLFLVWVNRHDFSACNLLADVWQ